MPELVEMPKLGMTMETGIITKWYKKEGDSVCEGEALVEVMTDKANMDVESPATGSVYRIFVREGEEVEVGKVIAIIELPTDSREELTKISISKEKRKKSEIEPTKKEIAKETKERTITTTGILATPLAKYIAGKKGINLRKVPQNKYGVVTEKSLDKIKVTSGEEISLSPMQKAMAARMTESGKIPQFTLYYDIDAENLVNLNNHLKEKGYKSSITPIFVKILASVMDSFPIFSSNFDGGKIVRSMHKNIGIAVQTEKGLIVPVVKDVDSLSMGELFTKFNMLLQNARDGKLTLSDMEGGTITISNLGMFGVSHFKALLVPGQTAIVAISAIQEKPVVIKNNILVRKVMNVSISCDHRIIDGTTAAKFMQSLRKILETKLEEVFK